MKRSLNIGIIGMMAFAGGLSSFPGVTSLGESQNLAEQSRVKENLTQQNRESQQTNVTTESIQKLAATKTKKKPRFVNYYDLGISPKTYGMNHVKRGTHKRTNV